MKFAMKTEIHTDDLCTIVRAMKSVDSDAQVDVDGKRSIGHALAL